MSDTMKSVERGQAFIDGHINGGSAVAVPNFGAGRQCRATDFNDLHQAQGLKAVKRRIEAALSIEPDEPRTSCSYGGGRFDVSGRGLLFIGKKEGSDEPPIWICSELLVMAMTRNGKSVEWGRLVVWKDSDGTRHQWAMPAEILQSDGTEVRRELARGGLLISPGKRARDLLSTYLQVWPVDARARCVDRLGWLGSVFVTPSEPIGQGDEIVVFQNAHALEPALSVYGTLEGWRGTVAMLASGNSRLVFSLSVAFAGTLAEIAGEDSGGFHLRGASSSGKSTSLKVAASVWGSPDTYPRTWRATSNGLEGIATLHNDGLLILDELSQIDPREAGEAAYMLANGQGKARASRSGTSRQAARWRLLLLSAGEESLSAIMARVGKRPNAGQEIRLADIEADAGAGLGAFEKLHSQRTPAALAEALKVAAIQHYGTAGVEWLRRVVENRATLPDTIADGIRQFVSENVPADASGQVVRVARRFGLVAVAGELATHYGITGWQEGEADTAARKCFTAWLEGFGGAGNREERAMLSQVRAFFEAHGASRFSEISRECPDRQSQIINRAGFFRVTDDGGREYLVLPEAFKRDVCHGFDAKAAAAELVKAGWLIPGSDGKNSQSANLPGMKKTRCYVFSGRIWEGE